MAEDGATADLWVATRAALAVDDRISPAMQGFLDLAEVQGAIGDSIYLEVPNDLARSMLDQRIRPIIEELLRSNPDNQEIYNFRVTTNPDIEPVFGSTVNTVSTEFDEATSIGSASSPEPARTPNSSGFETRLNPKYTFDNFVMGSTNILARSAAFAVADKPAGAYNPLFIYGKSGLGKTHLLHAIGHEAMSLYPRFKVRYVSSEEFTNDFINAIRNNNSNSFINEYRNVDILLIDDIQFLSGKSETQEAFFHTFNALHNHNKQVVITSDVEPSQLSGFEDRMLSRFEWGLKTDIQAPALETRIAILRKKAETEKVRVTDDILEYIAERVSSNVRELEGTLIRVTAFANLSRHQIDMPLVQTVLKNVPSVSEDTSVQAADIIRAVSDYFKISPDDLHGNSRVAAIAMARQIAMHLCREMTPLSLPKIGQIFGGRDHTTVMYATRKITTMMNDRRYIYNQVTDIIGRIRADQR
jgi:chromosomal replication initiator protein